MPLSVQCPACKAKLTAPDSAAGKRVKCPKCQTPVTVPGQPTGGGAPAPVAAAVATPPKPAVPTPPKAPVLPPMPAARPAVAPAPAAASKPTPSPAEAAPAFPLLTTTQKPVAPAKSGLGSVLLIVAALAGGGLLLCGGGVAAVVMYFLLSDSGAPAAPAMVAGPVAPAPGPDRQPVQPVGPVRPAPAPASNINWVAHEDSATGFKAAFPGGKPQPLDPLAEIKDQNQRELVAAFMEDWTVVGVTHAGRKYTLTAAPLELGNVPASVYLDRMSVGLETMHAGFSLEAQPQADSSAPLRDYVLKKDDAGKLLRVVATGGHVYQLLIEGEAGLDFSDPAAKEFFEKFQAGSVSAAPVVAEPSERTFKGKSKTRRRPGEDVADGIDWRPFQSKKFKFTVNYPGVAPQEEDPLVRIPEQYRENQKRNWDMNGVTAESYVAQVGDRRYGIVAFHDPNLRGEGSIRFAGQLETITRGYVGDAFQAPGSRGLRSRKPAGELQIIRTSGLTLADESKAVVREAHLGLYCFVIYVAGPATLEEYDPQVQRFLDSLQPPEGAAPLPLNVKPLPGPRPAKTKKKS